MTATITLRQPPRSTRVAIRMLWGSLFVHALTLGVLWQPVYWLEEAAWLAFMAALVALIAAGKNWARIVFSVMFLYSILSETIAQVYCVPVGGGVVPRADVLPFCPSNPTAVRLAVLWTLELVPVELQAIGLARLFFAQDSREWFATRGRLICHSRASAGRERGTADGMTRTRS